MEIDFVKNRESNETVQFQCPVCEKPYVLAREKVVSETPRFQCRECREQFFFRRAAIEGDRVPLEEIHVLDRDAEPAEMTQSKNCPQCHGQNPVDEKSCRQCGVVFEKIGEIPYEMRQLWNQVLLEYENITRHESFIRACRDRGMLSVATQRYRDIMKSSPEDSIASKMYEKVIGLSLLGVRQTSVEGQPWGRTLLVLGFIALSALGCIAAGLSVPQWRNLVGIGASVAVLTIGLGLFLYRSNTGTRQTF